MEATSGALDFVGYLCYLMPLSSFKVPLYSFLSLCLLFRCLQSKSEIEVETYVLVILQVQMTMNKKGGQKHIEGREKKEGRKKKEKCTGVGYESSYPALQR